MLELDFTARDLGYTRFALSPLWEVIAAVRVLKGGGHPVHEPWAAWARSRLAGFDWRLLADLVPVPTRAIPGFVAPPPVTPVPDLSVELAALRATPPAAVARELAAIPEIRTPRTDTLTDGLAGLCEVVEGFWELALAPIWPRIRSLLEGDVLHRARRMATGGPAALFAELDPRVRWADGRLRLAHRHVSGRRGLRGQGLLMVPSAFVWPRIFSITVPGWQPTLRYPPRGVGTLWEARGSRASAGLAGVLGGPGPRCSPSSTRRRRPRSWPGGPGWPPAGCHGTSPRCGRPGW